MKQKIFIDLENRYFFTNNSQSVSLYQIVISKKEKTLGKETCTFIGHYNNVSEMAKKLIDLQVQTSNDFKEMIRKVEETKKYFEEHLPQFPLPTPKKKKELSDIIQNIACS